MIEEVVTKSLILILGYAYPAFQCFKTVEKNRVEIHELRFWCQYWITVAVITVFEKIGDALVSWVPMYGEMKLALFIHLWYPRTKGTGKIYESFLRPYVLKHETAIDQSLIEFRERAWDLAVYYWNNCTELGSTAVVHFLQYVSTQSSRLLSQDLANGQPQKEPTGGVMEWLKSDKGPPPVHPDQATKSEAIKVKLQNQTQGIRPEDVLVPPPNISPKSKQKSNRGQDPVNSKLRHR